jgi:hypothetical protein
MSDEFGLQEGNLYTTKISQAKRTAQFGRMKTNHPIHPRAMSPKAVKEAHLKSAMKRKKEVVPLTSLLQRRSRRLRAISSKSPTMLLFSCLMEPAGW